MNTDMSREARQWMAALDDVLDTSSAQMLVNPKKGGGGPRSGLCYIATRVAHHILTEHGSVRYQAVCSRGLWGTHWYLRNVLSGAIVDLTGNQYDPQILAEAHRDSNSRAQGFVPTSEGTTWSKKARILFRMVQARHRVLYPPASSFYHYGEEKKAICTVYK